MPVRCVRSHRIRPASANQKDTDFKHRLGETHHCLHYDGLEALIPKISIYESTPVVNDEFLKHVRAGRCTYIHADVR